MSWRVADSLDVLRAEINAAAPARSIVSDGSIGDAAHATRDSDHNPFIIDADGVGVVRARDITHDPANGVDCDVLAERVRLLGKSGEHPALGPGAYVIWEGRIASATEDGEPWDWEPYTGSNAHTKHMHVSVALAAAGYDSTAPWGVMEMEDDVTPEDIDRIADRVVAKMLAADVGDDRTVKAALRMAAKAPSLARDLESAIAVRITTALAAVPPGTLDTTAIKAAVKAAFREGTD